MDLKLNLSLLLAAQDVGADFHAKHHTGSWDPKKGHYMCCSSINKRDEGCVNTTSVRLPNNNFVGKYSCCG